MKREAYYQSEDLLDFIAEGWSLSTGKPPEGVVVTDKWDQLTPSDAEFKSLEEQYAGTSVSLKDMTAENQRYVIAKMDVFDCLLADSENLSLQKTYLLVLVYHFLLRELQSDPEARQKVIDRLSVCLNKYDRKFIQIIENLLSYQPGDQETIKNLIVALQSGRSVGAYIIYAPWGGELIRRKRELQAVPPVAEQANEQFFNIIQNNCASDSQELKELIKTFKNKRIVTLIFPWVNEPPFECRQDKSEIQKQVNFKPFYEKICDYRLQYQNYSLEPNEVAYLEFKMQEQLFKAWESISSEKVVGITFYHLFEIYELLFTQFSFDGKCAQKSFREFLQDKFIPGQTVGPVNPILRSQFDFEYCGSWHVVRKIDQLIEDSKYASIKDFLEQLRTQSLKHEKFGKPNVEDYILWTLFLSEQCKGKNRPVYLELQSSIQSGRESIQDRHALANSANQRVSSFGLSVISPEVITFYTVTKKTPWEFLGTVLNAPESQINHVARMALKQCAQEATAIQANSEAVTAFHLIKAAQKILTDDRLRSEAILVSKDRTLLETNSGAASTRLALTSRSWATDSPKTTNDKYLKLVGLLALCEEWPVEKYFGLFSSSAPPMIEDLRKILNAIKGKSFDEKNCDVIGDMLDRAYRRLEQGDYPEIQNLGPKATDLLTNILLIKEEMAKIQSAHQPREVDAPQQRLG